MTGQSKQDADAKSIMIKEVNDDVFRQTDLLTRISRFFKDIDPECTILFFKTFNRIRIDFHNHDQAAQAKTCVESGSNELKIGNVYCRYFHNVFENMTIRSTLAPPSREKVYLLSPPASPPIGWEPIVEAEPVINYDLIAALAGLSTGEALELHEGVKGQPSIFFHPAEKPVYPKSTIASIPGTPVIELNDEIVSLDDDGYCTPIQGARQIPHTRRPPMKHAK